MLYWRVKNNWHLSSHVTAPGVSEGGSVRQNETAFVIIRPKQDFSSREMVCAKKTELILLCFFFKKKKSTSRRTWQWLTRVCPRANCSPWDTALPLDPPVFFFVYMHSLFICARLFARKLLPLGHNIASRSSCISHTHTHTLTHIHTYIHIQWWSCRGRCSRGDWGCIYNIFTSYHII